MIRHLPFSTLAVAAILSYLIGCSPAERGNAATDEVAAEIVQERVESARMRLEATEGGRHMLDAIEAHGGLEAWYEAPTSSYTWEYANTASDLHFKSFLVADNTTRRVYHDLTSLGPYGEPEPIEARFAWDGSDAWMYPPDIEAINPRFWATTGYYFEQIPFVFADPGVNLDVLPDDTLNGEVHRLVRASYDADIGDSPGDTYVVYIDPATDRVRAVRYTVTYGRPPSAGAPQRETLFEYGDYVTVDGLTVPTRFRGYTYVDGRKGELRNEAWADSISFRRPFDASRLEAPEGARFEPAPGA